MRIAANIYFIKGNPRLVNNFFGKNRLASLLGTQTAHNDPIYFKGPLFIYWGKFHEHNTQTTIDLTRRQFYAFFIY